MWAPARLIGSNRKGATLPLSVLVLALMAVAVAITYSRVSSERRTATDQRAQFGAFAVAQSGLSRYISAVAAKPGFGPTTFNYNDVPGGTAQVSIRMLRESTITLLPAIYVITSRGVNTAAKRFNSLTPAAERTVATYALWVPAPFDLNGAFTSLSGIHKNGNSGNFNGFDGCAGSGMPAIPGAAVPNGTYTGDFTPINGNPPDDPFYMGTAGTAGTARDEVDIDWAGILAGSYFPPNFVYPSWPTAGQFANWPVVRVNGDITLPSNGKGILIVTGDLTFSGAEVWEGLVLVGGTVTSNGNNSVLGATVSGLNVLLGVAVPQSVIANGNKNFQYNSCNLTRALGSIGSLQRVRNGWTDTWSSY
jgi:hypothetical protein